MGEIGFTRFDASGYFQSLPDAKVSWMRLFAERIDNQTFHPANFLRYFFRHCAAIAQISDQVAIVPGEEISAYFRSAMWHRQGSDFRIPEKKRAVNNMRFRFEIARKRVLRFKGKVKNAMQISHRLG